MTCHRVHIPVAGTVGGRETLDSGYYHFKASLGSWEVLIDLFKLGHYFFSTSIQWWRAQASQLPFSLCDTQKPVKQDQWILIWITKLKSLEYHKSIVKPNFMTKVLIMREKEWFEIYNAKPLLTYLQQKHQTTVRKRSINTTFLLLILF